MAKLADTTFIAGPDQTTATKDIYGLAGNKVINLSDQGVAAANAAVSDPAAAALGTTKADYSLVTPLSDVKLGASTLQTANGLKKDIIGATASATKAFNSLSQKYKDTVTSINGVKTEVTATVNGVQKSIATATKKELQGLTDLVNSVYGVACNPDLKNKSGMLALSTNLLSLCGILGLKDSLKCIMSSPLLDPKELKKVALNMVPNISLTGDIDLLKHLSETPQAPVVVASHPAFFSSFLYNYKIDPAESFIQYPGDYVSVMNSFELLSPGWKGITRNNVSCINASPVVESSIDFKKVLKSYTETQYLVIDTSNPNILNTALNTPIDDYFLLAAQYDPVDVMTDLRSNFTNTLLHS
jgi:hypothetical protein